MTTQQIRKDREATIAENASRAFAEHVVTVEHEDGLYRHYRCAKPGTGVYAFHVVTFPGRLIVCGDIGDMAWERCPDMLEWAVGAVESIGYFAEKTWGSLKVKEFDADIARAAIEQEFADREGESENNAERSRHSDIFSELITAIDDGENFYSAYSGTEWYGGDFPSVEGFTSDFLWCREAVKWFLKWYKARGESRQ